MCLRKESFVRALSVCAVLAAAGVSFSVITPSNVQATTVNNGQIKEVAIEADWRFSGVESRTDNERRELARQALEVKAKQMVDAANALPFGQRVELAGVEVREMLGGWSETHKDPWTGKRTHKCGGVAKGVALIKLLSN